MGPESRTRPCASANEGVDPTQLNSESVPPIKIRPIASFNYSAGANCADSAQGSALIGQNGNTLSTMHKVN